MSLFEWSARFMVWENPQGYELVGSEFAPYQYPSLSQVPGTWYRSFAPYSDLRQTLQVYPIHLEDACCTHPPPQRPGDKAG